MEGKTFKLSMPAIAGIVLAVAAITTAVVLLISGGAQKKPDTPVTPATPTEVAVPNVEGLERKDAEKLLANVHLDLGEITEEYSDTVARGHVISQDPKAGVVVKVDTPIQLVISKGAEKPTYVTMPDLIGKSHSEAEQALKDAQLVAVQGDPIVTTDVEPGKVCRQSIAAGAEVKAGTQTDTRIRLRGKGVPSVHHRNVRGDHYVTLVVQVPTRLNREQKKALHAFAKACGEEE